MATIETDNATEARLLLHQAMRLLEEHTRPTHDGQSRRVLRELAADLALDAVAVLRSDLSVTVSSAPEPRPRGWAG